MLKSYTQHEKFRESVVKKSSYQVALRVEGRI